MRTIISITTVFLIIFSAAACARNIDTQVTYYVVVTNPVPGAEKFGCDEYLVPQNQTIDEKATVEHGLKALFSFDNTKDTNGEFTAGALSGSDRYIEFDYFDPPEANGVDPTLNVYLKTNPKGGLLGICDDIRVKLQIERTVEFYAKQLSVPYKIFLNSSESGWRCITDQSGMCS